jgi:hypothetical protein
MTACTGKVIGRGSGKEVVEDLELRVFLRPRSIPTHLAQLTQLREALARLASSTKSLKVRTSPTR